MTQIKTAPFKKVATSRQALEGHGGVLFVIGNSGLTLHRALPDPRVTLAGQQRVG